METSVENETDILAIADTSQRVSLLCDLARKLKPLPLRGGFKAPELKPGWLLEPLLAFDFISWRRWVYWMRCMEDRKLPDDPIPKIAFCNTPEPSTRKMLERALDAVPNYGSWQGWSGSENMDYFLTWLLYGFGHPGHPELPKEPLGCEGAHDRLYQLVDINQMVIFPHDYFGALLSECAYGRGFGFFPTPHSLVEMMTQMTFGTFEGDTRLLTCCDPCVGTGRMPLHASNYSMRLYACDINPLVIKAALVNYYLYAPWGAKPLPFLDGAQYCPEQSAFICDSLAGKAPAHRAPVYANSEHDADEQWRYEPIKKRRSKKGNEPSLAEAEIRQGLLF